VLKFVFPIGRLRMVNSRGLRTYIQADRGVVPDQTPNTRPQPVTPAGSIPASFMLFHTTVAIVS
jgi:hypothetical protein